MALAVEEIEAFLDAGPAMLVRVEVAKGSTPREAGAWMLVSRAGIIGTIGGGQLEYIAIDAARALLARGGIRQVLDVPLGPEIGQPGVVPGSFAECGRPLAGSAKPAADALWRGFVADPVRGDVQPDYVGLLALHPAFDDAGQDFFRPDRLDNQRDGTAEECFQLGNHQLRPA
jgi:hypothetical protein